MRFFIGFEWLPSDLSSSLNCYCWGRDRPKDLSDIFDFENLVGFRPAGRHDFHGILNLLAY